MEPVRSSKPTLELSRLLVHPRSAQVVLEALRAPGTSPVDLTRTVMLDPALAAAVLRAANSAHLGYSRRIGGIRQASVMLGGALVGSLAASRVADLVFDTAAPDYPDWLWLHSLATACACSVVAQKIGESPDEAFTVGLLHDVGWLLTASNVAMYDQDAEPDHHILGAALLTKWNLPERVVGAVQQHHTRANVVIAPLDRIVVAGHGLAVALGATGPERAATPAEALAAVGLSNMRVNTLLAEVEQELTSMTADLTSSFATSVRGR
jgi:putative nucleotidyltransferase with HDIG domain